MQTKIPRFHDAQRGCLLRLQSAHTEFPLSFKRALRVWVFCAARSAAGLGAALRDMITLCVESKLYVESDLAEGVELRYSKYSMEYGIRPHGRFIAELFEMRIRLHV